MLSSEGIIRISEAKNMLSVLGLSDADEETKGRHLDLMGTDKERKHHLVLEILRYADIEPSKDGVIEYVYADSFYVSEAWNSELNEFNDAVVGINIYVKAWNDQ